jgi:hypothetical protein
VNGYERIIAILVDQLGGEVVIGDAEIAASRLELEMGKHPTRFAYRLRTRRVPADDEIVAEIIASVVPLDEYFANRREIEA